MLTDEERMRD